MDTGTEPLKLHAVYRPMIFHIQPLFCKNVSKVQAINSVDGTKGDSMNLEGQLELHM